MLCLPKIADTVFSPNANLSGAKANETWRNIYCSENCKSFFSVCSNYVAGNISANEANNKLESLDIPSKLINGLQKNLDSIKAKAKPKVSTSKPKKKIEVKIEEVKEPEVILPDFEPEFEDKSEPVEVKPKRKRGRPRKKKNQ